MISYRDMIFCPFWDHCVKGRKCGRRYDNMEKANAIASGLPVSFHAQKPDCFVQDLDYEEHGV